MRASKYLRLFVATVLVVLLAGPLFARWASPTAFYGIKRFLLSNGPGGAYGFYEIAGSYKGRPSVSSIILVAKWTIVIPYRVTTVVSIMLITVAVGISDFVVRQFITKHETPVA